jgi:phospholipase/lecithinase/hemolysin
MTKAWMRHKPWPVVASGNTSPAMGTSNDTDLEMKRLPSCSDEELGHGHGPVRLLTPEDDIKTRSASMPTRLWNRIDALTTVVFLLAILVFGVTFLHPALLETQADPRPLSSEPHAYWSGWPNVSRIFVFGDSYSDTRFDPRGTQPLPDHPLGNPEYPGRTSSFGENYVDFLTTKYNHSYIQTYNLAWAGGSIHNAVVPGFPGAMDMFNSVHTQFNPFYAPNHNPQWTLDSQGDPIWTSTNSLFIIFIGINDIMVGWSYYNQARNASTTITSHEALFHTYAGLLREMHASGARNFLILNVPAIEHSPNVQESNHVAGHTAAIADYNTRVKQLAQHVRSTFSGTTVFEFDTHTLFERALEDPLRFEATKGYKNVTGFCESYRLLEWRRFLDRVWYDEGCGIKPAEYFWLNRLHPTWPVHELLAQKIVGLLMGAEEEWKRPAEKKKQGQENEENTYTSGVAKVNETRTAI